MLVITKVIYEEVCRNPIDLHRLDHCPLQAEAEVRAETIRGHRFRSPNGKTVVIGNAADPADLLGIQFEAFENQKMELMHCLGRVNEMKGQLSTLRGAGFWTRLRYLFLGVGK